MAESRVTRPQAGTPLIVDPEALQWVFNWRAEHGLLPLWNDAASEEREPPGTVIYSSFASEPPDVWPALAQEADEERALSAIVRIVVATLLAVLLLCVVMALTSVTRRLDVRGS